MSDFRETLQNFELQKNQHVIVNVNNSENAGNRRISVGTLEWLNGKVDSLRKKFTVAAHEHSEPEIIRNPQRRISESDGDLIEMCQKYQGCCANKYTWVSEPFESVVSEYGQLVRTKQIEIYRERDNSCPRGVYLLPLTSSAGQALLDFSEMGGFSLGRGSLVAKNASRSLSRAHCMIYLENSRVYLKDCDSKTGTFVNGKLLGSSVPKLLESFDIVQMGYGGNDDDFIQMMVIFLAEWNHQDFSNLKDASQQYFLKNNYSKTFSNSALTMLMDHSERAEQKMLASSPRLTEISGPVSSKNDEKQYNMNNAYAEETIVFEIPRPIEPETKFDAKIEQKVEPQIRVPVINNEVHPLVPDIESHIRAPVTITEPQERVPITINEAREPPPLPKESPPRRTHQRMEEQAEAPAIQSNASERQYHEPQKVVQLQSVPQPQQSSQPKHQQTQHQQAQPHYQQSHQHQHQQPPQQPHYKQAQQNIQPQQSHQSQPKHQQTQHQQAQPHYQQAHQHQQSQPPQQQKQEQFKVHYHRSQASSTIQSPKEQPKPVESVILKGSKANSQRTDLYLQQSKIESHVTSPTKTSQSYAQSPARIHNEPSQLSSARPPVPNHRRQMRKGLSQSAECLIEMDLGELTIEEQPRSDNKSPRKQESSTGTCSAKTVKMPLESALAVRRSSNVPQPTVSVAIPDFLKTENLKIPATSPAQDLLMRAKSNSMATTSRGKKFEMGFNEKREESVEKSRSRSQFTTVIQGAHTKRFEFVLDFGSATSDISDGLAQSQVNRKNSLQLVFNNFRINWTVEALNLGSGSRIFLNTSKSGDKNVYNLMLEGRSEGTKFKIGLIEMNLKKLSTKIVYQIDDTIYKGITGSEIDASQSLPLKALNQLTYFYPHLELPSIILHGAPSSPENKVSIILSTPKRSVQVGKLIFESQKVSWFKRQMTFAVDLDSNEIEIDSVICDTIQTAALLHCLRYHIDN